MKRDMDLCRKILLKIEEEYVSTAIENLTIEGYTKEEVAYNCKMLKDSGMISDYQAQYADDEVYFYYVGNLTWDGHEYLDKIRPDNIWNKVKEYIKNKGIPLTVDTTKQLAIHFINEQISNLI